MRPALLLALLVGCASRTPQPRAAASPLDAALPTVAATDATIMSDACGALRPGTACLPGGLALLGAVGSEDHFELRPPRAARVRTVAIDVTEVSAGRYRRCVAAGRCSALPDDVADDAPASRVAWTDARNCCAFLGGRLPTEAEWQRAAGGLLDDNRSDETLGREPTPEGVRDLLGGVSEWVDDPGDFFPPLPRLPSPDASVGDASFEDVPPRTDGGLFIVDDPRGPSRSPWRVIRGRSATQRIFRLPTDALPSVGFRCVYDPASPSPGGPTRPYS